MNQRARNLIFFTSIYSASRPWNALAAVSKSKSPTGSWSFLVSSVSTLFTSNNFVYLFYILLLFTKIIIFINHTTKFHSLNHSGKHARDSGASITKSNLQWHREYNQTTKKTETDYSSHFDKLAEAGITEENKAAQIVTK